MFLIHYLLSDIVVFNHPLILYVIKNQRDLQYSNIEVQPVYIIHQKFEQVSNNQEQHKEYPAYGKNIIAIDQESSQIISFQIIE